MEFYTVSQVGALCHVGEDCVRAWLKKGKLPKTKAGGRTLIAKVHLEEFLKRTQASSAKRVA